MDDHDVIEATIVAAQPADDHIVSFCFISFVYNCLSSQLIFLELCFNF